MLLDPKTTMRVSKGKRRGQNRGRRISQGPVENLQYEKRLDSTSKGARSPGEKEEDRFPHQGPHQLGRSILDEKKKEEGRFSKIAAGSRHRRIAKKRFQKGKGEHLKSFHGGYRLRLPKKRGLRRRILGARLGQDKQKKNKPRFGEEGGKDKASIACSGNFSHKGEEKEQDELRDGAGRSESRPFSKRGEGRRAALEKKKSCK